MTLLDHLEASAERFAREIASATRDVELEVMNAVGTGLAELRDDIAEFASGLAAQAATHPEPIFALLRTLQPVLLHGGVALVTRARDVEEVLGRDDVFDVPYAERMRLLTNGENFFLGMADGPRYTRDQVNTSMLVRREDVATRVEPFVARTAAGIVESSGHELEIVSGLTAVVPARLVGDYFGTPGPSELELIEWATDLFWFLFLDFKNDAEVRKRALAASVELNAYLDRTISERFAAPSQRDDAIGRAIGLAAAGVPGMRPLDVRNNLLGLIIGAIPTTATAAAFALDVLLDRPDALSGARAAAQAGDDALFAKYVFEAMRFQPLNPGIFRTANRDYVLAHHELYRKKIPAGTTVVAATQSAMFDHRVVDDPNAFRVDRDWASYRFFGSGLHTCFGRHINRVQIPQILKPLLARQGLRRAPGDAGRLVRNGPFAGRLVVQFG